MKKVKVKMAKVKKAWVKNTSIIYRPVKSRDIQRQPPIATTDKKTGLEEQKSL
jgi:hypothetical protein